MYDSISKPGGITTYITMSTSNCESTHYWHNCLSYCVSRKCYCV